MIVNRALTITFAIILTIVFILFFYVSQTFFINVINMITDPVMFFIVRFAYIVFVIVIVIALPMILMSKRDEGQQ